MHRRSKGIKAHVPPPVSSDPTVLAYAAGIIDGEGSISISVKAEAHFRKHPNHKLEVRVGVTDRCLIDWLVLHFGGTVSTSPRKENCKLCHTWHLSCRQSIPFLVAVRPYLVIKGAQADTAFALHESVLSARRKLTPAIVEHRQSLFLQMKALNQRGRILVA